MSKTEVEINNLDFGNYLNESIEEILTEIGRETANDIKMHSPKNTGEYANGWTYRISEKNKTVIIYNDSDQVTLSHLLEYGTVPRKTVSTVSKKGKRLTPHYTGELIPREHIRPAYNRSVIKFQKDLEKIVGQLKTDIK